MIKDKLRTELRDQLPAYFNGTISPGWMLLVWLWLTLSDGARAEYHRLGVLRSFINNQPKIEVPDKAYAQIHNRLQAFSTDYSRPIIPRRLVATIILAITVSLTLIWLSLPPGINLKWTVKGGKPITFQVYKAPATGDQQPSSDSFYLVKEVAADPGSQEYTYFDLLLLPGESYIYRLEAVDAAGQKVTQSIVGDRRQALPGQLALLAVIGMALVNVWFIGRQVWPASGLNVQHVVR